MSRIEGRTRLCDTGRYGFAVLTFVLGVVVGSGGRWVRARSADAATEGKIDVFAHAKSGVRIFDFGAVVYSVTGHRIIPVRPKAPRDAALLPKLSKALANAAARAQTKGIRARRVNEVGNYMETFVRRSINAVGLKAGIPITSDGRHQSTGYPDVCVEEPDGRTSYLEIKTYNRANINTTQRSFYFSPPSRGSKVTRDARHLLAAFEIVKERKPMGDVYRPVHWKLLTLEGLKVKLKYEFNASNRDLYQSDLTLAEGSVAP